MERSELESFLFGLRARGVTPGLAPTRAVLEAVGNPDVRYPILQVAGTVGKGSTAAVAAAILERSGRRVGLFTSPHLVAFRERFRVDGRPVDDTEVAAAVERVRAAAPWAADSQRPPPSSAGRSLTFFEWATVIACEIFAARAVDAAVLEVGLGGRYDATTAAPSAGTALTRIDLDHERTLGPGLVNIAREKAAVIRPGVPVACAPQSPEVQEVVEARCRELAAPLRLLGRDFELVDGRYRSAQAVIDGIELGLPGAHQRENAAVAIAAVETLIDGGLSADAVRGAVAAPDWPGRLQELRPGLWLDGAHNPVGARALARALEGLFGGQPVHLVFAILAGRDPLAVLGPLLPGARTVTLTAAGGDRAVAPDTYLEAAQARHPRVNAVHDPADAVRAAQALAAGAPVVVCGSLYLVGEVTAALGGRRVEAGDPAPAVAAG